jgi:anti-sigma regulatory factor (Ser/Thr protein kinase)
MPSNSLRQSLCATPDAVPEARRMLRDFVQENCPESADLADPVALTVSEAVGNAVRHAYPGGTGPVEVEAEMDEPDLVVYVRDEGIGVGGPSGNPGLGLGMPIMRRLARLRIERRPGGGTQVALRFRCHT